MMARYIDADALTVLLHDDIDGLDEEFPNDKQVMPYMCGVRMALSFIETAPTINAVPRWIPCKERLPELDEICLVTEKDGSIRHCYFDSIDPVLFATVEEGMYVKNVVAWMPLPEPYEGERKDDETD